MVNKVWKVSDGSEFVGGEQRHRFNLPGSYLGSEFARSPPFLAGILLLSVP